MRPQGRAVAGFFPLPPGAARKALTFLSAENAAEANALDPCAGEGEAFKILLDGIGIPYERSNFVELTTTRGEVCAAALPGASGLYPADFINGVSRPVRQFSFVYCNPPYDDEIGGGWRVESTFLEKCALLMRTGGVILMVVPERTWERVHDFRVVLAKWFVDIKIVYPDADDRPYNEILIFGVRKDNKVQDWLGNPVLQFKGDETPFVIPTLKHACNSMVKVSLTEEEIQKAVFTSEIEHHIDVLDPIARGRPPLALGEGHNGMLVASGQAPPIVAPRDSKGRMTEVPHLVRGVSRKKSVLSDVEEGETPSGESYSKEVYTEVFVLVMTVLTHEGEVIKLESGSADSDEARRQEITRQKKEKQEYADHSSPTTTYVMPGAPTARSEHGGVAI